MVQYTQAVAQAGASGLENLKPGQKPDQASTLAWPGLARPWPEAEAGTSLVIRAKSIHSNRCAPSRDIARAFGQCNHIRHLFSGGYFLPSSDDPDETHTWAVLNRRDWRNIGPEAQKILGDDPVPLSCDLGLFETPADEPGACQHDNSPPHQQNVRFVFGVFHVSAKM
ncbi:hypothetical protein CPC08DRAFT_728909 [Agrocybe pediades]|nr:hypothetical protein CPC08DRAFT_728909 [Agrocybe pediades]